MRNPGVGTVRMRFKIPARGLLGYRSEFLTDTRGTGIMHHRFFQYGPWAGPLSGRSRGVMVSDREGVAVAYALFNLQERSEEHTSELQSPCNLVCRLLLEKKKKISTESTRMHVRPIEQP